MAKLQNPASSEEILSEMRIFSVSVRKFSPNMTICCRWPRGERAFQVQGPGGSPVLLIVINFWGVGIKLTGSSLVTKLEEFCYFDTSRQTCINSLST